MLSFNIVNILLVLLTFFCCHSPAQAGGNNLILKDGYGEEVIIKHGWFGSKQKTVKDRLGDKFVQKRGIFGSKTTEVNVLGNTFKKKRGLWGTSNVEGTSILGDKITTKKNWLGRRTTTVDFSGISSVIGRYFAKQESSQPSSGQSSSGLTTDLPSELEALPQEIPLAK